MKFEKSRRRVNNVTISFVLMNSFNHSTLVHDSLSTLSHSVVLIGWILTRFKKKTRKRVNNVTISFVLMNSFYYSTLVHELTKHFHIDLRKQKQATHIFKVTHQEKVSCSWNQIFIRHKFENWIADRLRLTGCLKTQRPLCEVVLRYINNQWDAGSLGSPRLA